MTVFRSLLLAGAFALPGIVMAQNAQATGPAEAAEVAPATDSAPNAAAEPADDVVDTPEPEMEGPQGLQYFDGADVDIDTFLWTRRLLVVMANTPADPAFNQQLREIGEREGEFVLRDVVVITDTDPAARNQIRQRLRPRGFMLAIIDKDGEVKQRRPAPRTAREIMAVIDRFPLRRQEMLEQRPSGRD